MIWIRKRKNSYEVYYNKIPLVYCNNANILISKLTEVIIDLSYKVEEPKVPFNLSVVS